MLNKNQMRTNRQRKFIIKDHHNQRDPPKQMQDH